jgi:hypothetical protein
MQTLTHNQLRAAHRILQHVLAPLAISLCGLCIPVLAGASRASAPQLTQRRYIEIVADHDSRFRVRGQSDPSITVIAGEPLRLHITAIKAKNHNRDGAVHGFTLLRAKDHTPVDGWDLELRPGTHDYDLDAPYEPGEYQVVCTVICSGDHEGMSMKFIVLPKE